MVRQYRIERFQGIEFLVCEVYRKHTWSQAENDALFAFREHQREILNDPDFEATVAEFKDTLNEFLAERKPGDKSTFYGISWPIPTYNYQPSIVLRGAIVDNRIASLQVDYSGDVLSPEVCDEVWKFYQVLDSRHWRDMVAHQIEAYGTLFTPADN